MDNFLKKYIYLDVVEFYLISFVLLILNFVIVRGCRKIKLLWRFNVRKYMMKLVRMCLKIFWYVL